MGCSQSTPSRTRRRRRRKKNVRFYNEPKEVAVRNEGAPTSAARFFASQELQQAPEMNYKSEHIDQITETPIRTVEHVEFKQATYTAIFTMRVHHADPRECRIRGAEFLPNCDFIVCDQANQSVKLWSSTFQYLAHHKLGGNPHDLCVHSSNRDGSDVYVTIPSERTIMELYVEGHHIIPGNKIKTDGFCYGIAAYKYGLIVGVGTRLVFMDTDGNVLRTIQYGSGGLTKFGSPFHLAVTNAHNVLISDSLKNYVMCITPDGDEIFRYEGIGIPHGLMVDRDDNIYVCGNEKGAIDVLHQITVRGEKVKSLLSWRHVGFTPDAIAFRPKDKLLAVCGENDRIKVFRLDKKKSGKIYSNDAIMDGEHIQSERSTKEVQDLMKRILDR